MIRTKRTLLSAILSLLCLPVVLLADTSAEPSRPISRTTRDIEGWKIRIDDRLLNGPDAEMGKRNLKFLEAKLVEIKVVVREDRLKLLQAVPIVVDYSHGKLKSMQYHPGAGWLKNNGYAEDLAKCVHIPRAIDLATKRNINEQPWGDTSRVSPRLSRSRIELRRAANPGSLRALHVGKARGKGAPPQR